MKRFYRIGVLGALSVLLIGCGNGSQPLARKTGRATITVHWPATRSTRLIPAASQSITVVFNTTDNLQTNHQLLKRPASGNQTTATFDTLPATALTMTASAYPNADGTGTYQATGTLPVTIQANQTVALSLTMASTITSVAVFTTTAPANNIPLGSAVHCRRSPNPIRARCWSRPAIFSGVPTTLSPFLWMQTAR